ncbi:glycosyltransferase family 2 protein, partial [Candidatus Gottesmanbacteria bacterium]|nr:glycosyltransferase family 2 protein [Candidatus Gottesmanbacteria bacterium]
MISVSFVIPLHNEEKNIPLLIRRIVNFASNKNWNYEIIPVDDRSTDNTALLLKKISLGNKKLHPVFRKKSTEEKGNTMGRALLEGTLKARSKFIIWTMGDLADNTSTYGKIIDKLETGFDLVFGSRYMPGGSRGNLDPLKAFLSSWGT